MIKYENDCVGPCPQGCIGSACPYSKVPHLFCDECDEEVDKVYEVDGKQVCYDCLMDMFSCISIDDL